MVNFRRISFKASLLTLTAAAGCAYLGISHGEDQAALSPNAEEASGPFVPPSSVTDTLSLAEPARLERLRRETANPKPNEVSGVLLANSDPDPVLLDTAPGGVIETFQMAEVRTGEADNRFQTVASTPRAISVTSAVESTTSLAAVSTGPAGSEDAGGSLSEGGLKNSEDLVRRIESLRTSFQAEPEPALIDSEPAPAVETEPSAFKPVAEIGEMPGRAERPYASAKPVEERSRIGSQVARTLVDSDDGDEAAAHAAAYAQATPAAPTKPQETEIAAIGSSTPLSDVATAAPTPTDNRKKGLLGRLFSKKKSREERAAEAAAAVSSQPTLETFPKPEAPKTRVSKAEDEAQEMVDIIYQEYVDRVGRITASDLQASRDKNLSPVPDNFETVWMERVRRGYWVGEEPLAVRLEEIYARALMNSERVRVYSYDPLIRETAIQESEGAFDLESFINGSYGSSDDPTSTILETGEIGRFLEERAEGDAGFRRRFATGGQLTLSNRFVSLKNNSEFTQPNPQTSSTIVLSVAQPLLKGAGYHYNKARLKVAKIDSGVAASEYVGQLENHLLEVNRAYWGVYFARAAYLLRKSLAEQTEEIVDRLDARADESTASELLRARSELSRRRTALNRSELAIRNAEEQLRSLVNDPEFPIGGEGEFVPVTPPLLDPPGETVHAAAMEAVDNRSEIAGSFGQLRIASIRKQAGKHEMLPQLDLIAESRLAGLDANRRVSGAYDDMLHHDASWLAGFQFSQPWERNFAKSRHERLQYEMLRQADVVRATMNTVLLESVTTYRELMTTYRDLQGNLQQVLSTREEVRGLKERLDIDADAGRTVAYRLQNVMDALERNQIAEEQFLVSVVTYNIAFAALERAKGTFLRYQDVRIERNVSPEGKRLEELRAVPAVPVSSGMGQGAK